MAFFRDIVVIFIIVSILTRIAKWLLQKVMARRAACWVTMIVVGIISIPIASLTIGFDVAIAEIVLALLSWLVIDLLIENAKDQKMEK